LILAQIDGKRLVQDPPMQPIKRVSCDAAEFIFAQKNVVQGFHALKGLKLALVL